MLGHGALGQFALGQSTSSFIVSVGTAAAVSSASAFGTAAKLTIGTAAAVSSASAAGLSRIAGVGTAVATSSALGVGRSIAVGVGTAAGISFAHARSIDPFAVGNKQFFFAYVGGQTDPAFSLTTTGDIWGGDVSVTASTWGGTLNTSADLITGENFIVNMVRDDGLVVGNTYNIAGRGIPILNSDGSPISVQFTYGGSFEGGINEDATVSAVATSLLITSDVGRNIVVLDFIPNGLVNGRVYGISGGGIPAGTTFTYSGSSIITISQNCTSTAKNAALKITSITEKNIIKNLGATAGLVVGQTYNIFGQGISAGTISVYEGGTTLTLSTDAVTTYSAATIRISKGVTYYDGGPFNPLIHMVEDEKILSIELTQSEGDFASLSIEVPRPNVGLLNPSRKVWAWFSWDTGTVLGIVGMFHGRLIGMPEDTGRETITLKFIARPEDYQSQKITLANSLKVAPYWDEVFLAENSADPDTVLTARSQLWHVDRSSLVLTVSDIINAEDGTIEIDEVNTLYENFDQNYLNAPLRSINVTATVNWTQTAQGTVDLTSAIYQEFSQAGSGSGYPVISSFTGDGLKSDWPVAYRSLGGGWSMDGSAVVQDATWAKTGQYPVKYTAPDPAARTTQQNLTPNDPTLTVLGPPVSPSLITQTLTTEATYDVLFPLSLMSFNFVVSYDAARSRTETVSFSLEADVQAAIVEPGVAETETLELHSNFVAEPIDPNGEIPIGDLRRNTYFKSDRGQQSFQYLMMLATAKLLSKARCVEMKLSTNWLALVDVTCRKNIHIVDRRILSGEAIGKVTGYTFKGTGDDGNFMATAKLGCTIGNGNSVSDTEGTAVYAFDGYMVDGYQQHRGGHITLVPGALTYQSFDDFIISDDDGVDFTNMVPSTVIIDLEVTGGRSEQQSAIDQAVENNSKYGDPVTALSLTPTRVKLQLQPVTGGPFQTEYSVITSLLSVPKTIDLGG